MNKRQPDLFADYSPDSLVRTPFSLYDLPLEPMANLPDRCLSLDLLTPLYRTKFQGLSEGEQHVLDAIFRSSQAVKVPGSSFTIGQFFQKPDFDLPDFSQQDRRLERIFQQQANIRRPLFSAYVSGSLVKKNVLTVDSRNGQSVSYRLMNPALETWYRARVLGIVAYGVFFRPICPVLKDEQRLSPTEFWQKFCQQAGVDAVQMPVLLSAPSPRLGMSP